MSTSPDTNGTNGHHKQDVLLDVKNLKMYFPVTSGILFQRTVAEIKASTISASSSVRVKRWDCRREWLWQNHNRPVHPSALQAYGR